jgi:hypothetical protein
MPAGSGYLLMLSCYLRNTKVLVVTQVYRLYRLTSFYNLSCIYLEVQKNLLAIDSFFRRVTTMKNTMIRAFVVALALSGFVSTAHSKTTGHALVASSFAPPTPLCPLHDPNGCGIR